MSRFSSVLLTGATGFVGAFLLRALIDSTTAQVYCLTRGSTDRIQATQENYGLGRLDRTRVVPVAGDLTSPDLGLGKRGFVDLAGSVDVVVHAAAEVNLVAPARMLAASNVDGTREVLRLAKHGGATMIYLSTSEVFGPAGGVVDERVAPEGVFAAVSGYGQTKRAGELLVLQAHAEGLPAVVHRLDRIVGDSRTGACQPDGDDFWLLVRSALSTGILPDASVNVTPVDFAANAVVALATECGPITHICHPHPIRMTDVAAALNHPVELLPPERWTAGLSEMDTDDPFVRLLPVIGDRILGGRPEFRSPHTTAALRRLGQNYPPVDVSLIGKYVGRLRSTGFLTPELNGIGQ